MTNDLPDLDDVEAAIVAYPDPVVSVPEMADELDVSTSYARDQMRLLERAGALESKDVGARATAWWSTERVTPPRVPPEDHPDQSALHDAQPDEREQRDAEDVDARENVLTEPEVREVLNGVDWPQNKDPAECVNAVVAAHDLLAERGSATMRVIVNELATQYPLGYSNLTAEDGERFRGGWWRSVVKPGLEALPDVQKPPRGGSDWTISDD